VRLCADGLHRQSIFVVIVRDFTDNIVTDFDLRAIVHVMMRTAPPSF
jgi:hypothetical protein